jgi:hypothetical protein
MRFLVLIVAIAIAALVMVNSSPVYAADAVDDQWKVRDAVSPTVKESPVTIEGMAQSNADDPRLLSLLEKAKREGDSELARQLEACLAARRGEPLKFVSGSSLVGQCMKRASGNETNGLRWADEDILVTGSASNELAPSLATDADGILYVAVQIPSNHEIAIFRSTDGGQHWSWKSSTIHSVDITYPSLDVGQGNGENWLLMTYVRGGNEIRVIRYNLDNTMIHDETTLEINALGVSRPRLVTDSPEYETWYPYVVYNTKGVDSWYVRFSRSLDYGASWTSPVSVAPYCGTPGQYYNASDARPDIEFGSGNLHITYDNYPPGCAESQLDVYVMTSVNYGGSWGASVRLTTDARDEKAPRIASVKEQTSGKTTMVTYARDWAPGDFDVMYALTQDDGATWNLGNCLACSYSDEVLQDVASSFSGGGIYAAWLQGIMDIAGAWAQSSTPHIWNGLGVINEHSQAFGQPTVAARPTESVDRQMGFAWQDLRNSATAGYDIYYDGATTVNEVDAPEVQPSPLEFWLSPAQPNPAERSATVAFRLPEGAHVSLRAYDSAGRLVRVLLNETLPGGHHTADWDGRSDEGAVVAPGVYFLRIEAGEFQASQKVVLLQ